MPLIVGAKYSSFAALQVAISDHENSHFVQYFKRNSRTIESFQRHYPSKRELRIPQIIEYPELDYACIHGGKPFRSKANQRPKQRFVFFALLGLLVPISLNMVGPMVAFRGIGLQTVVLVVFRKSNRF